HPARRPVSEVAFDLLAAVPEAHDHSSDAVSTEQVELVVDERPPRDLDHCLGNGFGNRPQALRQPAGEEGYGNVCNVERYFPQLNLLWHMRAVTPAYLREQRHGG